MTNLFTNLSNRKLKYVCALVVFVCVGVGNVWAVDPPTLSNLSFPTPLVQENFNNVSTTRTTSQISNIGTSQTNYGEINSLYNNDTGGNNTIAVASSGNNMTSNYFSLTQGTTKQLIAQITGKSFSQSGAWRITIEKSSTYYFGLYNTASSSSSFAYGQVSAFLRNVNGAISIQDGTSKSNWTSVGSSTNNTIDICVIYNLTNQNVTYGGSISLGSMKAHVYIDGTCVNTAGTPTAFTLRNNATVTAFRITTNASGTHAYVDDIKVYSSLPTAAASCSANPTIGTASLNGSFNMTSTTSSIGVSSGTCSTGNAACDWTDYGFVWSDGANTTTPTVGGTNCNKVQVGTTGNGTSWTGSITPSGSTTPTTWTTGHTYYVRTYGKNSKAGAAFVEGTAWSFTPYSVTFKANGGTGSDKVQYVRDDVSTTLTSNSFTKTGYTFNGWNTDADGISGTGYTNGQSVSLSANLTLYAKWSAKQCTISFDIEGGSGTITNVTATYGQAMPSKESNLPTKTGYNFGGFWDGDGGTGTQYYNADGTSKINWNKDVTATQTLYAKWTIKNYTVTWKVNGEDYTAGTPTDNVNHGSHVTTLPTAPSTASYCGDKFMGWTDATDGAYVHGTSNLYTKASEFPNATGNQVFYAVFADYVAP